MSRPSAFRLQTLFDLKERAKKNAQEALAAAQSELRREQAQLEQLNTALAKETEVRVQRRSQYAERTASGGSLIHHIHIQELHIQALKEKEERVKQSIEEQKTVVETRQRVAQSRHLEMLNANRAFKSIEKLKEQWALELKKQIERKEEEASDEISQSRYVRNIP